MTKSRSKGFNGTLLENAPSIIFFVVLYLSDDLRVAGWFGTFVAAIVIWACLARKINAHPILLGINIYLLIITPVAEMFFLLNLGALGDLLVSNAQSNVLASVFLMGLMLTIFSRHGFIAATSNDRRRVLRTSVILLAVTILSFVWTLLMDAGRFVEVGIPFLLLFGLRYYFVRQLEVPNEKPTHNL